MSYIPGRQGLAPDVAEAGPAPKPTWAKFVVEVLSAKTSTTLAFVLVLGLAVSVGSVAQLAAAEILSVPEALPLQHKVAIVKVQGAQARVLGDFTSPYGSSVLVSNKTLRITYGPVSAITCADCAEAQATGWIYGFTLKRFAKKAGSVRVSDMSQRNLFVGDVQAEDDISISGFLQLNKYRFEYYSQKNLKGTLLLRKFFVAQARLTPPPIVYCPQDAKLCPDGSYVSRVAPSCEFNSCPLTPPAYGYQTVSVRQPVGGLVEGWLDRVDYGSTIEPGSLKIGGWAYNNGSPATALMSLRNRDTGIEYSPEVISYDVSKRDDVISYLKGKTNISNPAANYFAAKFSGLPAGYYYIYNANYNGNLFNIHNQAYQPIYISSSPPGYGYQTVNVGPVNKGGWREGWLEQFVGSDRGIFKVRGWAFDDGKELSLNLKLRNDATGAYYYPTLVFTGLRQDVGDYLTLRRGGASTYSVNGMFEATFSNLPKGGYHLEEARYNGYLLNASGGTQGTYYISNENQDTAYVEGIVYHNNVRNVTAGDKNQQIYSFRVTAGSRDLLVSGFEFEIAKFPEGGAVDGLVSAVQVENANDSRVRTNITSVLQNKRIITTFNGSTLTIPARQTYDFNVYADFAKTLPAGDLSITLKRAQNVGNQTVLGDDFINGVVNVAPVPIQPPYISVSWPTSGDVLTLGKTYTIKWNTNIDSNTLVNIYLDSGSSLSPRGRGYIAKGAPNNGSFSWDSSKSLIDPYPSAASVGEDYYSVVVTLADGSMKSTGDYFKLVNDPAKPRLNQLIIIKSTVYLVGLDGLYGFADLATFNSWQYSFYDLKDANDGEKALAQVGLVPMRDPFYANPFEQLKAKKILVGEILTPTGKVGTPYSGSISWSGKNISASSTLSASLTNNLPPGILVTPQGVAGAPGSAIYIGGLSPSGKLQFTGSPTKDGVYPITLTLTLDGQPEVSYTANFKFVIGNIEQPRVGKVINVNGTVYLVGNKGLYGFPDVATFISWGLSFSDVVTANAPEASLVQVGMVNKKTSDSADILKSVEP